MKLIIILFLTSIIKTKITHKKKSQEDYKENQYCLSHNPEKNPKDIKCNSCIASIETSDYKCKKINPPIPYCMFYKTENTCNECQLNFKLSKDSKKCQKIKQKNCLKILNEKKCRICKDNFLTTNGKCEKKKLCKIENCSVCEILENDIEYCHVCNLGFSTFYENDSYEVFCVAEGETTQNCALLVPGDQGRCEVCDVGFYQNRDDLCVESEDYDMRIFGAVDLGVCFFFGLFWIF